MAAGAVQVVPVIDNRGLGLELRRFLVAVGTGNGDVPSGEREMSFLVLGQRKRGRLVAIHRMTTLASIEIRRTGKLSRVPVAMAICAAIEFDFEYRVLAFRNMALRTFQPRVATLQRIRRGRMFLDRELRWLPALHRVTGRALSLVRTFGKLAFVCILVAVHALGEYQRLLKVAIGVALGAVHTGVLSLERKLRFGVIKALIDRLQRNLLPAAGVMTGLASLRKAAVMRILMTLRTLIEWNAYILRLAVRPVGVALGALHLQVQSRQRVACLGMIELADVDRLPIDEVVARKTILAKAALVLILVAGDAGGGKAEIGSAGIFDLDHRPFLGRNVRGIMALGALQTGMLSLENVTRLFMIKGLDIPLNQGEIFTVVLGMAAGTLLA